MRNQDRTNKKATPAEADNQGLASHRHPEDFKIVFPKVIPAPQFQTTFVLPLEPSCRTLKLEGILPTIPVIGNQIEFNDECVLKVSFSVYRVDGTLEVWLAPSPDRWQNHLLDYGWKP